MLLPYYITSALTLAIYSLFTWLFSYLVLPWFSGWPESEPEAEQPHHLCPVVSRQDPREPPAESPVVDRSGPGARSGHPERRAWGLQTGLQQGEMLHVAGDRWPEHRLVSHFLLWFSEFDLQYWLFMQCDK